MAPPSQSYILCYGAQRRCSGCLYIVCIIWRAFFRTTRPINGYAYIIGNNRSPNNVPRRCCLQNGLCLSATPNYCLLGGIGVNVISSSHSTIPGHGLQSDGRLQRVCYVLVLAIMAVEKMLSARTVQRRALKVMSIHSPRTFRPCGPTPGIRNQ